MRRFWTPTIIGVTALLLLWRPPGHESYSSEVATPLAAAEVGGSVYGVLCSGADGQPVPHGFVLAGRLGGPKQTIQADSAGRYDFGQLSRGRYLLTAFSPNRRPVAMRDTLHLDSLTHRRVDFMLDPLPLGRVSGSVLVGMDSLPTAGAHVWLVPHQNGRTLKSVTGHDGAYSFRTVPAGRYLLVVADAASGLASWPEIVEVSAENMAGPFTFWLPAVDTPKRISGRVSDAGLPLSGVDILACTGPEDPGVVLTQTDIDGRYGVSLGPASRVYIWARRYDRGAVWFGSLAGWETSHILDVAQEGVNLELKARAFGPWSLGGTVAGPETLVTRGLVSATDADGHCVDLSLIWPDGRYLLTDLPAGTYTLRLSVPGLVNVQVGQVTLDRESRFDCNLRFSDLTAI